jgi:UDP-glucuronate 4-epimerase
MTRAHGYDARMRVLVTGTAGFIGYHLAERLLARGDEVIGLDVVNDYYDVRLKEARLERLTPHARYRHERVDLADGPAVARVFREHRPERVVHLAAQAGVRYSLTNPDAYVQSNLVGFMHVLEGCRHGDVEHLVYASSSSVYGANTRQPFSTSHGVDHPVSLYAASKKANELMAHTYAHLYGLPTTGLRFFTVYGPWGRPDMALYLFTRAILAGEPIRVFNHGRMRRDFTYVDDIVDGICRVMGRPPKAGADGQGRAPYKLYNIGNNQPVQLLHVIDCLEQALGITIAREMVAMQPGDVPATYADIDDLTRDTGFRPETPIETGIEHFARWYRDVWQPQQALAGR